MVLDFSSLHKSIDVLERSLNVVEDCLETLNDDLQETVRAGVIQNFEVAYEQCWKFIQRWIRENRTPEEAESFRTRKELFRIAARIGLISDPAPWFEFGDARNLTSHTYDETQAIAVFNEAKRFLPYAKELVEQLKVRND